MRFESYNELFFWRDWELMAIGDGTNENTSCRQFYVGGMIVIALVYG